MERHSPIARSNQLIGMYVCIQTLKSSQPTSTKLASSGLDLQVCYHESQFHILHHKLASQDPIHFIKSCLSVTLKGKSSYSSLRSIYGVVYLFHKDTRTK